MTGRKVAQVEKISNGENQREKFFDTREQA
jgi:hypothetical protein